MLYLEYKGEASLESLKLLGLPFSWEGAVGAYKFVPTEKGLVLAFAYVGNRGQVSWETVTAYLEAEWASAIDLRLKGRAPLYVVEVRTRGGST